MKLSAVIATANRAEHLEEAYATFVKQTRPFDEIIVADASSDVKTKLLVNKWVSRLPLIYMPSQIMCAAVQRDMGVKVSSGDIIYFLDDDVLLDNLYVEKIAHIFAQDRTESIGGVSGTIINQTYGKPSWITKQYLWFMSGKKKYSYDGKVFGPGIHLLPADEGAEIREVEWLPTVVCAYRKKAYESVGGFGSFFKGYSMSEDFYLSSKVVKNWKLVNTRKARLYHKDLGGKTHRDWRDIGYMSVINRWMVVRDVLHTDTPLNKFKLGISLLYGWISALRNLIKRKEHFHVIKKRIMGQVIGYMLVLKNNGQIN